MNNFADNAISFFLQLSPPPKLPEGVEALFPFKEPMVQELIQTFFHRYFSDAGQRIMLIGINPGRFGAGITGINFTAPRQLAIDCGISHYLGNSSELSAEFMYAMIHAFGGPSAFYQQFYLAAASPVGFTSAGKNLNYYDDPKLAKLIRPYIIDCLGQQLDLGFHRKVAICIGGDKNYKYLQALNQEYHFFEELLVLPHPRFIMQYRRASMAKYVEEYLTALQYCLHK